MILPIVVYGNPILRKEAEDVSKNYPDLNILIDNMFETMYKANGVGLAAPQIDLSIKLFVVDTDIFKDDYPDGKDFKQAFINPEIIAYSEATAPFNEGCLSLPDIHEDVWRSIKIKIKYTNIDFKTVTEEYDGIRARVIQHEYDHLQGNVFTDKIGSLRKMLLKRKLSDISGGRMKPDYKIKLLKK